MFTTARIASCGKTVSNGFIILMRPLTLWWVKVGHIPSVQEAKERLEYLRVHGETPFAFSFRKVFDPDANASPGSS